MSGVAARGRHVPALAICSLFACAGVACSTVLGIGVLPDAPDASDGGSLEVSTDGGGGAPYADGAQPDGDAAASDATIVQADEDAETGSRPPFDATMNVVPDAPYEKEAGPDAGNFCPTLARCAGNAVETCTGLDQWSPPVGCIGQTCINGACAGMCAPTQQQCSNNTPQTCGSDGMWTGSTPCAQPTPDCVGSSCTCSHTACPGACVDLQSDVSNCGYCGHGCQGGGCLRGVCQPVTLAGGTNSDQLLGIAVDGTNVYFTDYNAGTINSVPKGGGKVTILATPGSGPLAIAVDSNNLYWTERFGSVEQMPIGGTARTPLATDSGYAIAVDAANVYWMDDTSVRMVPIGGGNVTPLASGYSISAMTGNYVAVSGSNVYWAGNVSTNNSSGLYTVPLGGDGGVSAVATYSGANTVVGVALDSTNLYWGVTNTGPVYTVPLSGGTPAPLGSNLGAGALGMGSGIAVDSTGVYLTAGPGGNVYRVPLPGGPGTASSIAQMQNTPWSIAVDSTSVYFTTWNSGVVMKVAKP
jgi:hypothetical protein